jgi:hypothetical protein
LTPATWSGCCCLGSRAPASWIDLPSGDRISWWQSGHLRAGSPGGRSHLGDPASRLYRHWITETEGQVAILGKTSQLVYIRLVLQSSYDLVVENEISPVDWPAIVGSQLDAQDVLITTCGNIAVIGMLSMFVIYPFGYFLLLFDRFLALTHAVIRIMVDSRQCYLSFPDSGMKHLINRTCHRRKRVCSFSQRCGVYKAITTVRLALQGRLLIESPSVAVLAPGGVVGSTVKMRVSARIPLFLPGGNTLGLERLTSVQAEATFRQEGW